MGRSKLTIQQGNVQRVLKAAKQAGHDVFAVEVDASTGNITLLLKQDGNTVKKIINSSQLPTWSARKVQK